jgi:hypothetical protein
MIALTTTLAVMSLGALIYATHQRISLINKLTKVDNELEQLRGFLKYHLVQHEKGFYNKKQNND